MFSPEITLIKKNTLKIATIATLLILLFYPTQKTKAYLEKAEKGEGLTHLARRALREYLKENPQEFELTKEHKIYIEDYLAKALGYRWLQLGEEVEFKSELIKEAISKAQQLTPTQLENLSQFAKSKEKFSFYKNDTLGVSFQYPHSWGKVEEKENIELNYLFPSDPPEELIIEFTKRGLSNDFIATFRNWDREKQLNYLLKDRTGYGKFLNKKFLITFSENDRVKIYAFNRDYVDFGGYECAVFTSPIYKGNLILNEDVCFSPELFSQIKIENFYSSDCKVLSNKIVRVIGTSENNCSPGEENAYLLAIGNLKRGQEYSGLVIEYFYKTYENAGSNLMNLFGYSGYGPPEKQIKKLNISACNAISGGSAPSSVFAKYSNRTIDETFIQDFINFITDELNEFSIDKKIKDLVIKKFQEDLRKNKGKKFVDFKDRENFSLYFEPTKEVIEKVNEFNDIETYFPEMNPNDLNCAIYKIIKKLNLDAFRRDVESNPELLEVQLFIKNVSIY